MNARLDGARAQGFTMIEVLVAIMTWTCSRQRFGKKVNTENLQSAKIVVRNAP